MPYDTTACLNPSAHRAAFRRRNGSFKTRQWRRAMNRYNRCIAGVIESTSEVIGATGDAATDLAYGLGLGGERPAYVPPYAQAGGPTGGEESWTETKVAGLPLPLIAAGVVALMLWSK